MSLDFQRERQQVHSLVDLLSPAKLGALRNLLEVMMHDEDDADDDLTEQDRHALRASEEYFRTGGEGIPFEQVVAQLGLSMEQIRGDAPPKD